MALFYRLVVDTATIKLRELVPAKALAKSLDKAGFADYYEDALTGYFELTNADGNIVLSVMEA